MRAGHEGWLLEVVTAKLLLPDAGKCNSTLVIPRADLFAFVCEETAGFSASPARPFLAVVLNRCIEMPVAVLH
jgi:hypothetical protein